MPASASRDASATSSPIPKAFCSPCWCMRPISRTRMVRCRCCARCATAFRGSATFLPIASIAVRNCAAPLPTAALGPSRSSSARPASKASSSCPGDGWSSALSPGSAAAAASPKTSSGPSPAPPHGFSSPASAYSRAVSQEPEVAFRILSQTLRSGPKDRVSKDGAAACFETRCCAALLSMRPDKAGELRQFPRLLVGARAARQDRDNTCLDRTPGGELVEPGTLEPSEQHRRDEGQALHAENDREQIDLAYLLDVGAEHDRGADQQQGCDDAFPERGEVSLLACA